jgi:hypothetical protein
VSTTSVKAPSVATWQKYWTPPMPASTERDQDTLLLSPWVNWGSAAMEGVEGAELSWVEARIADHSDLWSKASRLRTR